MSTGQCCCGAIRYELNGPLRAIANCHCRICRRTFGSAFFAGASISSEDLTVTHGQANFRSYETSDDATYFCERCRSPLFIRIDVDPATVVLAVASLDEEPTEGAVMHLNVESKAPWYEILDDLPQYDVLSPLPES